jgi:phosphatidylglycerophosphate synthase
MSISCTVIGLMYIATIGYTTVGGIIISIVILLLGYALDSADGQLARLRNLHSEAGEYLDHIVDCVKMPIFHITVTLIIIRSVQLENELIIFYLLTISVFASAKYFSSEIKEKLLTRKGISNRGMKKYEMILLTPFDYGVMCFIFLFTLFDLLFQVYVVWGFFYIVFCMLSFVRSFKQLSMLS